MLDELKHCKKAVGVKQSTKAVEAGIVASAFIAKDCEQRVSRGIIELCEKHSIPITYVDSMKQLGKACGIEVEAAIACILK
ncbi:MAG TPA: ribosomal L7Ae/L30e/S12e/Gadd45 family protein [Ruminiclostridium sp.]